MNPVLLAQVFHRVFEVDWFSSNGSDDFHSYGFAADKARAYPAG